MSPTTQRRAATAYNARRTFEAHPPVSRVASHRRAARPHKTAGFTLLEMLAVIFLMSIVLFVAIDFYLDLSLATKAATDKTRSVRRATVLLDRVARDLEGAVLLKTPDDVDPNSFPWLFVAQSESSDAGADRVKFVRRGHRPKAAAAAESDLEIVAWIAVPDESGDGDVEVRRASWSQLPESLDRSFPTTENSDLVAGGLASFGIRFLGEAGEWTGSWDSTMLVGSSELPTAAEIEVSFRIGPGAEDIDGPYLRRVLLPLRPIDLEEQLAAAGGPAGANPRDQDGDGKDDETGEPVEPVDPELGDVPPDEDEETGEMTVAACLGLRPDLEPLLRAAIGNNEGALASVKSLSVSQVPAQFSSMVPAECRQ